MAERGEQSEVASAIAEAMRHMGDTMLLQAQKHAEVTVRPRMPGWAVSTLVGLVVSAVTMLSGGLVAYGAMQSRITALENAHPESISALAVEVHAMRSEFTELMRRFNDMADHRK